MSREAEVLRLGNKEMLEIHDLIIKIKNAFEGLIIKLDRTEKWISPCKNIPIDMPLKHKGGKMKNMEQNIPEWSDNHSLLPYSAAWAI